MKFFRTPTLFTVNRRHLASSDSSNYVILFVVLAGFALVLSAIFGKGCFLFTLLAIPVVIALIVVPRSIAAKRQATAEAEQYAATQQKAQRFEQVRRLIQSAAAGIDGLTIERFVEKVKEARTTSGITPEEWAARKQEIYNAVVWDFVKTDSELSEHEEAALAAMAQAFKIDTSQSFSETRAIDAFRRLRTDLKQLPIADAPVPLKRGEICHYVTTGSVERIGGGTARDGDVVLTNKRILVVGDGVVEIRIDKILKVGIDPYSGTLTFSIEGRQNPILIRVRDSLYFGKLTQHLSDPPAPQTSATREETRKVVQDVTRGIFDMLERKRDESAPEPRQPTDKPDPA